ncbi:MAG: type IV pilus modification protein PilV [Marinagarivorans sp.]|nr:type IV pilus modification protein PilV [Marinagarivorans sp.]
MKSMKSSCEGVTLIEVLVALFVLAIGLLGVVSLQAETLKLSQQSFSSTQALFLANDMAERMRANKDTFVKVAANAELKDEDFADVKGWGKAITSQLPGAEGTVTSAGAGAFVIAIKYDQQALANEAATESPKKITYALNVRL